MMMLASIATVLLANALGQAPTSTMAAPAPFPYCGMEIQLKSWKGDYLNRSDAAIPITAAATGAAGNKWTAECTTDGKVKLKSTKGDYLNRTDLAQGATVATAATGTGTVWTPAFTTAGKLVLRSSVGDGLHRPDSPPAVTSWGTGIGNEWTLEPQPPANACYLWKGRGGAPQASYMAAHASCRPWNGSSGWSFIKKNNGVDYYRGTFKEAGATPSIWAVYADFGSAAVTSKADYDSFVANTKLSGSCGECLH